MVHSFTLGRKLDAKNPWEQRYFKETLTNKYTEHYQEKVEGVVWSKFKTEMGGDHLIEFDFELKSTSATQII